MLAPKAAGLDAHEKYQDLYRINKRGVTQA